MLLRLLKAVSYTHLDIKPGNALFIKDIPVGTLIHNIELYPGKGAQLVRSAGNSAQLMACLLYTSRCV